MVRVGSRAATNSEVVVYRQSVPLSTLLFFLTVLSVATAAVGLATQHDFITNLGDGLMLGFGYYCAAWAVRASVMVGNGRLVIRRPLRSTTLAFSEAIAARRLPGKGSEVLMKNGSRRRLRLYLPGVTATHFVEIDARILEGALRNPRGGRLGPADLAVAIAGTFLPDSFTGFPPLHSENG